jgi:hypothetical protein
MQPPKNLQEEIAALETEISNHKKLLDKSISEDEVLEKTKEIFHELKVLSDKLLLLKKSLLNKA